MLFDLRGRGRRRTVRVIYGSLAVLFGAGLVLFGVGAGFGGGGSLSSLSKEGESSGGPNYSAEIKKYSKLTAAQPHDFVAWEKLDQSSAAAGLGRSLRDQRRGADEQGQDAV